MAHWAEEGAESPSKLPRALTPAPSPEMAQTGDPAPQLCALEHQLGGRGRLSEPPSSSLQHSASPGAAPLHQRCGTPAPVWPQRGVLHRFIAFGPEHGARH